MNYTHLLSLTEAYNFDIQAHRQGLFFRSTSPNTNMNSGRRQQPIIISAIVTLSPVRYGVSFRATSSFRSESMISERAFFSA